MIRDRERQLRSAPSLMEIHVVEEFAEANRLMEIANCAGVILVGRHSAS